MIQFLIASGADVGATDNYFQNALHHAAGRKGTSIDVMGISVEAGCSITALNAEYRTPLEVRVLSAPWRSAETEEKLEIRAGEDLELMRDEDIGCECEYRGESNN